MKVTFFLSELHVGMWCDVIVRCINNSKNQENVCLIHRYTPEIPDPVPFWSLHGAQFGGHWVIKIIVVRQVHKVRACTAVWAWRQSWLKNRAEGGVCECICFALASVCVWSAKTRKPPNWAMADDAITMGQYRTSGISGVYLWFDYLLYIFWCIIITIYFKCKCSSILKPFPQCKILKIFFF